MNIGTGKIELIMRHPTGMATQTWANTQLAMKASDAAVSSGFADVQVQLTGKVDDSQVLTNVPFRSGLH